MLPRTFYCLVALCFAVFVAAAPSPQVESLDPDAEEFIEVEPEPEVEIQGGPGPGHGHGHHHPRPKRCRRLAVRKEWRDLSNRHKLRYINAVKCLQSTQALNATMDPKFTRYDEFVWSHVQVAEQIHGVGQFLPWHRHFGWLYEQALRNVCGYRGPFPYWDWTRDTTGTAPIHDSPIFDTIYGLGGDGVEGTYTPPTDSDGSTYPPMWELYKGCVGSGHFAGTIMHVGPGKRFSDHCLVRGYFAEPEIRDQMTAANIAFLLGQTTYDGLRSNMDGQPFFPYWRLHDGGHGAVGGDMSSFYSSPNDPIFFPHHAGVDRIWWEWQKADFSNRLYQINGPVSLIPPHGMVTLDYQLPFADFIPDVTLRDAMDIRREPYCYTYG
ncbi:hypothetical protein CC1G_00628 [Coprinopsis cinerea okayama7|uniref:Tyrosinase copper-binding domain-containing protein n=1 Tax=Coprinopsis cinerea (strain Okayama-7 / 130 / ATCC MYA-4618 / FGSC 9003) TaxID=240176 RepID=A8N3K9_COPC7|nr:hypothetical protein CC1G_00628 [Coprinopsis cinerea okayama7\|eukprot:XP_001829449.1 hypothetical protein CC1G_00628 [Coprinopsis cinerea okayama7\